MIFQGGQNDLSIRAEGARAGGARAEGARAESARAESARAESARAESARAESARRERESRKREGGTGREVEKEDWKDRGRQLRDVRSTGDGMAPSI